jgi:hypothetical protein
MSLLEQAHRYGGVSRSVGILLIYVVVSVIVLGVNPFRGETVTPFDLLMSQPAWSSQYPGVQVRHAERSDVLDAGLPFWLNSRAQMRAGHLPFWNDTSGGAEAFPLTGSSLLTPAYLVFAASPRPPDGFYLAVLANLIIAGVGMHLFLRRHLGFVAACVGAVSFAFCGFHAAWLYWPHTQTSIWAPWLLLAVAQCADRPSASSCIGIGLASAMVILGGFPFVGMLVFGVSGLYLLARCAVDWDSATRVRPLLGWYTTGIAFGFLLCALPLYSFTSWLGQYDLGYRGGGSALSLQHWRQLFAPWAYRAPRVEFTMYVGMVVTVLALLSPLAMISRRARSLPLPIFGMALLVVSAGVVFGFWPKWLVGWFPGMSSNAWSRAICILDLALVILGAWMFDRLWGSSWSGVQRWGRLAVVLLAAVQIVESGTFFRSFNGPVSKQYFYPATPAISHMQAHMGRFDYVIADNAFLVSGTLGAYGLREWFAHQFRGEPLRRALLSMADHPFTTPTASRLSALDIKLSSPAMAVFNVRYVAINSAADPSAIGPNLPDNAARSVLPAMPSHRYAQQFRLTNAHRLAGVSIRLATYRESEISGVVKLVLRDHAGTQLATVSRAARSVADNAMEAFHFEAPIDLVPGTYSVSLSFDQQDETRSITAWAFTSSTADAQLTVNEERVGGTLDYLLHPLSDSTPFRRVLSAAGVTILENTRCPGGPYFLPFIEDTPDARSGSQIEVTSYRADHFTLNYTGTLTGYVVVPMKMRPDWEVLVDDAPVEIVLKEGLMPAVPVTGPARITFSYRPRVMQWFVPWLIAIGAALLVVLLLRRLQQRAVDDLG